MNVTTIAAAGLGLAAAMLPAGASAQHWQPIAQRQASLDARIDQGIRSGALNRAEATRLRGQFRDLDRLELRYRQTGGLSQWERRDLERRYDALSARVRFQKTDRQHRR